MLLTDAALVYTYSLRCSDDMCVMSFEILVHVPSHNDTFCFHRVLAILHSYSILQCSGT